ncbi:hypothetical protein [Sphingomonas sp.]|uniref:hypothetical protein n=1 Tax=Sphingomonas sp. TaxID=28214 RepID=UPI0025D390D1|nr:hypothetical protein [Sphingomonas sp.]MBV9528440.1 hypothetical protein [Sphingomonas sp.]
MNAGPVPLFLLAAALGLALSFTSWRAACIALLLAIAGAGAGALIAMSKGSQDILFAGLLASTLATAALVYLPKGLPPPAALIAGVNAGVWLGLVASVTGQRMELIVAIPFGFLFLPGHWIVERGYSIAIKVVCSWLIAIAALAIFVSLVPTPGYKPDHME